MTIIHHISVTIDKNEMQMNILRDAIYDWQIMNIILKNLI